MATFEKSLVWFRRDLRVTDHAALYHALKQSRQVYCVFVYDRDILDPLLSAGVHTDRRIDFIMAAVDELDSALRDAGGALIRAPRVGAARDCSRWRSNTGRRCRVRQPRL